MDYKKPPMYLYKYHEFSVQNILNLKNQCIYFCSPLAFNDPYDCAISPAPENLTDDQVERIRVHYLGNGSIPESKIEDFRSATADKLREVILQGSKIALESTRASFLAQRGVTCFSERNDDLLMWAHYGGRYKGFCLEFKTCSENAFAKVLPVTYASNIPLMNLSDFYVEHAFDPISMLYCIKSHAWAYEKEWRAFHEKAGTSYCYSPESLTGVYFGPDIDDAALEVICLVLQGQNKGVRFWRGNRSDAEYKVEFTEFKYSSHLRRIRLNK